VQQDLVGQALGQALPGDAGAHHHDVFAARGGESRADGLGDATRQERDRRISRHVAGPVGEDELRAAPRAAVDLHGAAHHAEVVAVPAGQHGPDRIGDFPDGRL